MSKVYLLGIFFLWLVFNLHNGVAAVPYTEQGNPTINSEISNPPPNPQCDADVPYLYVDLTGNPDSTWLSPNLGRKGNCCGTSHPDRCISFTVVLDKNAVGLEFSIAEGAIPSGSLFYQVDCGSETVVGEGVCLPGGYAYEVTFCKPGANKNIYQIRSIPGVIVPDTVATRIDCPVDISISGVDTASVTWNDVTGGGVYNKYLSCTSNCLDATFIPDEFAPSTILYEVCGDVIDETCGGTFNVCDSVVVEVHPKVEVSIIGDLTFCSGFPSTLVATATPVSSTYTYEWYDTYNAGGNLLAISDNFIPPGSGSFSVVAADYGSPLGCSFDTLNFDVVATDCIPICPEVTICPNDSVIFNTITEFLAAGGIISFPCSVNDTAIQLISEISDGNFCPEIITQTYEIWDDCGNRERCNAQITRTDTIAPTLAGIPGDITVICSTPPDPPVIYTDITATDNCDPNVEITMAETSTQTFDNSYTSVIYQIIRTWTAVDDCGNSTSQSQTINAICEYCHNGIDDDGDGAIDESDPDCPCTAPNYKLTCDNKQYYYIPPVWQMNTSYGGGSTYTDPSSLVISTPFGSANVSIRTADGTTFNQTLTVTQGTAEVVPLTFDLVQTPNYNAVENDRGLIIESDQLIQVLYRITADNNKMLVTIKGEQALGTRFRAGSQTNTCGTPNTSKKENHFISVMAVEDNTTVNFEYSANMKGLGATHSVTLNAGETYLMIDDDNNQTITGSLIYSDKSIAVITGSQHSRQCNGQSGRDAGADQLIPSCGIGTDYVVTRGEDDDATSQANYAVIVAVTSNTEVFINGSTTPAATLNPGEFYTYNMPGPDFSKHYIKTNNPAYLYQFGSVQPNGEIGMAIAAPIDGCRGDRFVEFYRFPNSTTNKVATLVPNAGLSTLTLNGNPYTDYASAEPIPGLPTWSSVTFMDSDLSDYNIIESDELFNASQFVGNSTGGTFGYLTSFKDKIFVYDPHSGLPTYNYFTDTICADSPYNHCITSSSCSGNQFITSIKGSSHTESYSFDPNSTCFEYIPKIGYNGLDTITVLLSDDFGFTQAVCISFYICGTLPQIAGVTDSTGVCDISEIPVYADFNEFLADGGTASDDCSGLDMSSFRLASEVSDGNTCPETITRTYEISNFCGLSSSFTQTIVIDNNNLPTLVGVPNDTTVNCDAVPASPVIGTDIIGASYCGIPPTITFDEVRTDGSCPNDYLLTRTWTVTDECANSYMESQIITVIDTIPPTASNLPSISVQCISDVPAPNVSVVSDASDNCSADLIVAHVSDVSDGNTCPETISRTYSITDECGNSTDLIQLIIINDDILPLISCIPDLTVASPLAIPAEVNTFMEFMAQGGSASDNCELDTASFVFAGEFSSVISGNNLLTRTYQIADICGNIASCDQLITVGPPITSADDPDDTWVECIEDVPTPISGFQELLNNGGNATSTCGIDTTSLILTNQVSDGNTCPEIIYRTYEISDSCGNVIQLNHQITVHDITPPSINCLPDTTISPLGLTPPAVTNFDQYIAQGGTASDNCELDSTSFVLLNETTNVVGGNDVITRTYQITDLCGNTATCDQQITVIKPITGSTNPPDEFVECIEDVPTVISSYQELINEGGNVTSSCGVDTASLILVSEVSDGNICPEVITRTYEVADSCGNSFSLTHQITIDDITSPIIICLPDTTVLSAPPVPPAAANIYEFILQGGTVSDNCGLDSTSFLLANEVTNSVGGNDVMTRTYQIADLCGNVSTCDQEITIGTPTTIADDPNDVIVECIDEVPLAISSFKELLDNNGNATSTCGIDTSTFILANETSDGNTCPEIITRTYELIDSCGNTISLRQQITVDDITPPVIDCLTDTSVLGNINIPIPPSNFDEFIQEGGNASDNCELDSTSFVLLNEVTSVVGGDDVITRTFQIADLCGNTIACDQEITVVKPIITTSDPITENVECIDEVPLVITSFQELINKGGNATSTCGIDTTTWVLTYEVSDGNTCPQTITRTYEISDSCGTIIPLTHEIVVDDITPPILDCLADTSILGAIHVPAAPATLDEFIIQGGNAFDNCELDTTSFTLISEVTNVVNGEDVLTRTFQVADLCGNITICEQDIEVVKPVVTFTPITEDVECIDEVPTTINSFQELLDNGGNATSTCGIDTASFTLISEISDGGHCPEVITRTYEISDFCATVIQITQVINVHDITNPEMICMPDTVIYNEPTIPEPVLTLNEFILNGGLASDNCELDTASFMMIDQLSNKVGNNEIYTRTYQVSDMCGNTVTCEHKITHIAELNKAPTAQDDNFEGGCYAITGNLLDNDYDLDGHHLLINMVPIFSPNHGTLTLFADGSFTYDFTPGTAAIDSFVYEICDEAYDSQCTQATAYITIFVDNDCDGVDDVIDIDDDDDGIIDTVEGDGSIDSDGDGIPDSLDIDSDNDGIVDNIEVQKEGYFIPSSGIDDNNNGLDDAYEDGTSIGVTPVDTDSDGTPDYLDLDTDDDGVPDIIEGFDIGAKGIANKTPTSDDYDNDGYDDAFDSFNGHFNFDDLDNPFGSTAELEDFDDDGWRDWRDVDDDGDGIPTKFEDLNNDGILANDDFDNDGHPEYLDLRDECELFIPEGFSPNGDGVHDYFQIYCIEKYPNAKLIIFDRWGNKLYEHEKYGNLEFWGNYNEAWWDGTLSSDPGRKVRPETHLYILETTPGSSERGFVMVSY